MKRVVFPGLLVVLVLVALFGCGSEAQRPTEPDTPLTETAEPSVSPTALIHEARLMAAEQAARDEEPPKQRIPEDHWLVGTSPATDMMPATVAPEAPRVLVAEYGPAWLEQVGEDRVLHLKGSHYDMGYQHGTLLKEDIILAASLVRVIGTIAFEGNYGVTIREVWERTSPYIPAKYKEEMRGMADATGLSLSEVQDFSVFPEMFHCSGFALWGKATADGELLHGRVLDYMRDAGLDRFAAIIIQEPETGNAFVNVAYAGMVGSVTGMNDKHVAIGEMGGRGEGLWDGMPMTFLVRECLESANTLDEARRIMEEAARTCEYYYVISDSKAADGRGGALGVAAVPESITFIGPNEHHELLPRPVEDAVLLSAGDRYDCLVDRVEKQYGAITPEIALDIMARGVSMRSNMHNVLFKPRTLEIWVANSTVEQPACNRPYRHYDVAALIATRPAQTVGDDQ